MVGLISKLPKDLFELVVITTRGQRDMIACQIEAATDQIYYLSEDLFKMQEEIGDLQIDFLIYADIGMDIRSYFLAFSRLKYDEAGINRNVIPALCIPELFASAPWIMNAS